MRYTILANDTLDNFNIGEYVSKTATPASSPGKDWEFLGSFAWLPEEVNDDHVPLSASDFMNQNAKAKLMWILCKNECWTSSQY